ncbi:MAG: hypothetical protein AAFZ63_16475 [Bacteroidota bacterium]
MMNIESIERQFRAQLKDHESFDLDTDLTWNAIETELNKQKIKWRGVYILLLGLLGLLGLLFVNELQIDKAFHASNSQNITSSNEQQQSTTFDAPTKTGAEISTAALQTIEAITSLSKNGQQRLQHLNANVNTTTVPQHLTSTTTPRKLGRLKKDPIKEYVSNSDTNPVRSKNVSASLTVPTIQQIPLQSLTAPKTQPAWQPSFSPSRTDNQPQYKLEASNRLFRMTNNIRSAENEYATLRNQTETPQISWAKGVHLWREKPSGWLLGLGLEYQNSTVQFRYQGVETETTFLPDTVLHILIDPQTQDTIARHFGDIQLEQHQMRDVQHYNIFKTLSLPIHVGFVKATSNKLTYGITGGISFQYHIQQSGRLLAADGTIINFSDDSYFRRVGLSTHIQTVLIFKGGDQWEFSCNPFFAFSLSDRIKSGAVITQRPFTYGLSLGIAKAL